MEINDFFSYRENLLDDSRDEFGFISEQLILSQVLPMMLEAKLVDSEDYNDCYFFSSAENLKINAYAVNETGERLQIFLVDENAIDDSKNAHQLCVSVMSEYSNQIKRAIRFVSFAINGKLNEQIQDSDPTRALVSKLSSSEGIEQFDVIEIFLLSLSATVSLKGPVARPRSISLNEEKKKITYEIDGEKKKKEILILPRVIDLNFLTKIIDSKGDREPLTVNFNKQFGSNIEVIQAAGNDKFESYLCVFKAEFLAELYKHHSSRLLEKNVRSWLQFKGYNQGIKETIKNEPERFIAYNNGLTITASSAIVTDENKSKYIEALTDFQIVNGGQTTASIYFAMKDGLDISKVKVMAKINVVKENDDNDLDDFIVKISKFSNSQTRVSDVDLRSRNPQLILLKTLSSVVITPSGNKWFFERFKGEFNTEVRKAGRNSTHINKEFPKERRFSKEELAKYYCAWGDEPYLVKKGGEKIFRHFIEKISSSEDPAAVVIIDKEFFENLISKIILFRELEKIYGQGKKSIGQLRSATVPYAISIIYVFCDGSGTDKIFNLEKIWRKEGLDAFLVEYFKRLLILINDLIRKYSKSDDLGEYSKKPELWNSIKQCTEIHQFMGRAESKKLLDEYTSKSNSNVLYSQVSSNTSSADSL